MSELPKRAEDKVNTFGIILIGVSSAILLWATIVLLQAYYENTAGPLEARRSAMAKSQKVRDLRSRQQATIRDLKWVDQQERLVSLPIEEAMRKVVEDLRADPRGSVVPAVGPHDQPTIPEVAGPPDPSQVVTPGDDPDLTDEELEEAVDHEEEERGASDEDETAGLDEDHDDEGASAEP